jgi:hypothetical protein
LSSEAYNLISADSDVPKMQKPTLVKVRRTGKRGRPRKEISAEWLAAAMAPGRRITLTKLAEIAGVHRHTLRAYLIKYGVYERFCNIPDHDLDLLVRTFKADKPSSGLSYVVGFLRRYGLKVQRRRVRGALGRVDNLGSVLRRHQAVDRRKYSVPHSNYLWHLDGHHKLIRWGIVIHGIVDGYCRTVSKCILVCYVLRSEFRRLSVYVQAQIIPPVRC